MQEDEEVEAANVDPSWKKFGGEGKYKYFSSFRRGKT